MLGERVVKGLEVSHPFLGKTAVNYIHFIEDDKQGRFALVQNRKRIHHVAHEGVWILAPHCISNIEAYRGKSASKCLSNDLTGSRLGESLNLPRRVDNYIVNLTFFGGDEVDDLVELGCEKVEAGENGTVRTELV